MKSPNVSARIERSLRQRLLSAYRRALPSPPARIVVGFSGGPDSLALAILLSGIARAIPSRIHLLHIDHRLRAESGDEARLCGELADRLGLPFRSIPVPDHPVALFPGAGLEEAARRARYEAFAAFSGDEDVIALAHHAGDQAETVLLHLMHGAGMGGMAGMRAVSELSVPWWERGEGEPYEPRRLTIWRPLLTERRNDLLAILEHYKLTPLLDPSNDDTSLKRNAVRHLALPVLRQIEPTIDERLGTLARIAADEEYLLDAQSAQMLLKMQRPGEGIAIEELREAPVALARRVVRRWLEREHGLTPTFERVEAVLDLARSKDQTARLEIGEGLLAGCFGNALRIGTLLDLQHRAWLDAGLILPLADSDHRLTIDGDTITVEEALHQGTGCAVRSLHMAGQIGVERARPTNEAGDTSRWNEWFRHSDVSPWIRELVLGITIDGLLWWIPRRGDYDDAGGGRRVRVVWSEQVQELS